MTASVAESASRRISLAAFRTGQFQFLATPIAKSGIRGILVLALRAFHVQRPPSMQHKEQKKEEY
jgi:hypothetical protein